MKKLFVISKDEAMSLILLAKLTRNILLDGMTPENKDHLIILYAELERIVDKITYM